LCQQVKEFSLPFSHTNALWTFYNWQEANSFGYDPHTLSEMGLYTNSSGNLVLDASAKNCYGLPISSIKVAINDTFNGTSTIATLNPGVPSSYTPLDGEDFFPGVDFPGLQIVDYYFASQTPYFRSYTNVYWYGPNWPAPPMPGSPSFSVTNTSPLLIAPWGQEFIVSGWAKMAITNGYSGKYAYLEQYWDKAYKTDTNGLATTNQTGLLSPYGEFFPTEPGPTALVTMPDIDTGQRGTGIVNVIKLQLDVNHDGVMDLTFGGPDNTSQDRPFVFWVNNDSDPMGSGGGLGHEVNSPQNPDCGTNVIQSQRDLEDYARLWIVGVPAPPPGDSTPYSAALHWKVKSGHPSIKLFSSVEVDGGVRYLTETNTAEIQSRHNYYTNTLPYPYVSIGTIDGTNEFTQSFYLPASFFTNAGTKYLLFEAADVGEGELVLTIRRDYGVVATTSAWLDLRNVKDLFEHAHIENVITTFPSMRSNSTSTSTFKIDSIASATADNDKEFMVLVHGWNNNPWQSESYAETMFKRLYWQGYQGGFAALRWPTLTGVLTYNGSEYIAFRSAAGTSSYLNSLRSRFPDYSINAAAHSMGNIVMMEALKLQAASGSNALNNYVLMEAAVPAHCYDTNAPLCLGLVTEEFEHPTPNTYLGYPGALTNALRGNIFNFFSTNDFALAAWVGNQLLQKPESDLGYQIIPPLQPYWVNTPITDPREIMAFCARPRSYAIGAQPGVHGMISGAEVDLHVQFGFGADVSDHSGQYNRNIQQLGGFYFTLRQKLNEQ